MEVSNPSHSERSPCTHHHPHPPDGYSMVGIWLTTPLRLYPLQICLHPFYFQHSQLSRSTKVGSCSLKQSGLQSGPSLVRHLQSYLISTLDPPCGIGSEQRDAKCICCYWLDRSTLPPINSGLAVQVLLIPVQHTTSVPHLNDHARWN